MPELERERIADIIDYNKTEEFIIRESINENATTDDEDISLFVDMMYHR